MILGLHPANERRRYKVTPSLIGGVQILSHTHTPPSLDKMATILQMIFSDAFSWKESFVFWLKFHWSLFLRILLTNNPSTGLENGLAPNRRQDIVWTNADQIHWRIYAARGEVS